MLCRCHCSGRGTLILRPPQVELTLNLEFPKQNIRRMNKLSNPGAPR